MLVVKNYSISVITALVILISSSCKDKSNSSLNRIEGTNFSSHSSIEHANNQYANQKLILEKYRNELKKIQKESKNRKSLLEESKTFDLIGASRSFEPVPTYDMRPRIAKQIQEMELQNFYPEYNEFYDKSKPSTYSNARNTLLREANSIKAKAQKKLDIDYGEIMYQSNTNPNHIEVEGYLKSSGTYVNPYMRTAPNNTIIDNFSTKSNVNPYTGKVGTRKN